MRPNMNSFKPEFWGKIFLTDLGKLPEFTSFSKKNQNGSSDHVCNSKQPSGNGGVV
jgi:hypothetical protein